MSDIRISSGCYYILITPLADQRTKNGDKAQVVRLGFRNSLQSQLPVTAHIALRALIPVFHIYRHKIRVICILEDGLTIFDMTKGYL